jgi:1-acyl-sn-glycerol-3-phosphate acyltransferase
MIRFLKLIATFLWIVFASVIGSIYCLVRFGNLNNNARMGELYSMVLPILGVRRILEGGEHLNRYQPCVYIANHQGMLDVPLCGTLSINHLVIIGKKELKYFPFFGMMFAAAGNYFVDRSNRTRAMDSLARIMEQVNRQSSCVFVFPEGTRNRVGGTLLPFKKGAFVMALDAQIPLVPIVIERLDRVFDRATKEIGGTIRIRVLPPIETKGLGRGDMEGLIATSQAQMAAVLKDFDSRPANQ